MNTDPNILNEIREISPLLADLHGINVFQAPDNYFQNLPESVLIRLDKEKVNLNIQEPSFEVPNGYFESLSLNILKKIKEEEMGSESDELPPVLSGQKSINPFFIPQNYFETFPQTVLDKIRNEDKRETGKIVSFHFKKIYRYATAAVIAVGLFLTSYLMFQNNSGKGKSGFAVVTRKTVDDPGALKYNSEKAFNEGIASLSDDQIIRYLEKNGNSFDMDALINSSDTSGLPNPEDYLIDENTLNNYLNKINYKNFETQ